MSYNVYNMYMCSVFVDNMLSECSVYNLLCMIYTAYWPKSCSHSLTILYTLSYRYLVSVTSSPGQVQAAVQACKEALSSLKGPFGVMGDSVQSGKMTCVYVVYLCMYTVYVVSCIV